MIAVIILNYNGKKLLQKFLPSIITRSKGAKIVVADNNSSDGSQNFLKSNFSDLQLIFISKNLGFCAGYNYALRQVSAKYYVLLNSDVEVSNGWLTPIIDILEKNLSVAAVQPKILSYKSKTTFEYAGAAGGHIDFLGYPFCRGRVFGTLEQDKGQYNDIVPIFWATGACLCVRSTAFHDIEGLDESFFAHMEEVDLCWRLNRQGYTVMYCGKSTVYHIGGATLPKTNYIKTYYNFRNGMKLLIKNMDTRWMLFWIIIRILLDWLASIKFLCTGYPQDSIAVLRAHAHLVRNFAYIYQKRKYTERKLPSYQVNGIYQRLIIFDYFVLQKKHFNLFLKGFKSTSKKKT